MPLRPLPSSFRGFSPPPSKKQAPHHPLEQVASWLSLEEPSTVPLGPLLAICLVPLSSAASPPSSNLTTRGTSPEASCFLVVTGRAFTTETPFLLSAWYPSLPWFFCSFFEPHHTWVHLLKQVASWLSARRALAFSCTTEYPFLLSSLVSSLLRRFVSFLLILVRFASCFWLAS